MSLISFKDKTLNAKIVYYGTALSGKTTSLKVVHSVVDPEGRVELVSLNTEGDRTLFFDFLPIPLGTLSGFQVKLQAFTVPGQVKYHLTRRFVLRGADAVIFVADSRAEAFEENVRSLASLQENLVANGLDPAAVPIVLQYNKRDAPDAAPIERLRAELNRGGAREFETTATTGAGVFDAFSELCAEMMERLAREFRIGDPETARRLLHERLDGFAQRAATRRAEAPSDVPAPPPPSSDLILSFESGRTTSIIEVPAVGAGGGTPDVEQLLERAVDVNIEAAKLMADLNEAKHRLSDHVKQLAGLHETGVVISSELDGDRLLGRVLDAALRTVGASLGSVLLVGGENAALVEKMVRGFSRDPLARGGATDPRVMELVLARRPFHLEAPADRALLAAEAPGDPTPEAALCAPLVHKGEALGAIVAYLPVRPAEAELNQRLRFLAAVAAQAAVALENSRLYARVETLNRDLEKKVADRTRDLERAYRELQVLDRMKDDFLASMSHELLTPLTSISSFAEILAGMAGDDSPAAAAERVEFSSIVQREAVRLTDMLQSLLDLSRIEADKVVMTPSAVDLKQGVVASYQRLRPHFKARRILVKVSSDDGMPPAWADPRWIARVFDALLGNAAKFGPENSEVRVVLRAFGGWAHVEIRDHGAGVPERLRASVFDKFKQAGDVLTDKPPGLGLGLPMARAIVERQGGSIRYEPAQGGGSVFAFALPVMARDAAPAPVATFAAGA
jgi:signal transduction histidine kinase/signal recognition particle receptor subunit beta